VKNSQAKQADWSQNLPAAATTFETYNFTHDQKRVDNFEFRRLSEIPSVNGNLEDSTKMRKPFAGFNIGGLTSKRFVYV